MEENQKGNQELFDSEEIPALEFKNGKMASFEAGSYDWTPIEIAGDWEKSKEIKFTLDNQFIDCCLQLNDTCLQDWSSILKSRRKSFIIARGEYKKDLEELRKTRRVLKYNKNYLAHKLDPENARKPRRDAILPAKEVYCIFATPVTFDSVGEGDEI